MASLSPSEGVKYLSKLDTHDFTIECQGHGFPVNKDLLAVKSPFFAACVKKGFKEGEESKITLSERHPYVISLFVLYIYTGVLEYKHVQELYPNVHTIRTQAIDDDDFEISTLVQLWLLADEWMIGSLKQSVDAHIMRWKVEDRNIVQVARDPARRETYSRQLLKLLTVVYLGIPEGDTLRVKVTTYAFHFLKATKMPDSVFAAKLTDLMKEREPLILQTCSICSTDSDDIQNDRALLTLISGTRLIMQGYDSEDERWITYH